MDEDYGKNSADLIFNIWPTMSSFIILIICP